jgi:hypothetical protein
MTGYVVSPGFQGRYVKLPTATTPLPARLLESAKFFPWFECALGAIDGSHIYASPSAEDRASSRNRKGDLSQNLLAACTFHMLFCYINSGWEGSASDSYIFDKARSDRYKPPLIMCAITHCWPVHAVCAFQMGTTILLMLDLPIHVHYWCPIVAYVTTCASGHKEIRSEYHTHSS